MAVRADCCVCEEELTASGWLLFGPPSHVTDQVSKRHLCLRHGALLSRVLILMRSFQDCAACDGDGRVADDGEAEEWLGYCVPCHGLGVVDRHGRSLDWLV